MREKTTIVGTTRRRAGVIGLATAALLMLGAPLAIPAAADPTVNSMFARIGAPVWPDLTLGGVATYRSTNPAEPVNVDYLCGGYAQVTGRFGTGWTMQEDVLLPVNVDTC